MPGSDEASCRTAAAVKALAQQSCGRSVLIAAGAEVVLTAAAESRQGAWSPALAEALEMLRRAPEGGPGPLAAGSEPQLCAVCGAPGSRDRPLKQCGGCRGPERWCSAQCQRGSWPGHKAVCQERRAAAATAGTQRAV
jgi:hypothetical protein